MIRVSELESYFSDLPQEFLDSLPVVCPSCGFPTIVRESLTTLSCANVRCPVKVAARMVALAQSLRILGIGQAVAEKMVAYWEITNPLALLQIGLENLEPFDKAPASLRASISNGVQEALKQPVTLPEYVSMAFLPGVQSSANQIFKGFSSLEEAYLEIEAGGVGFIQQALGISGENSLRAAQVYRSLMEFKEDLMDGLALVDIQDLSELRQITLCISASAGAPFTSKADFMEKAKQMAAYSGYHLVFSSSLSKSVEYLIHAGGQVTNKYQTAQRRGIPIFTGHDFMELMRERAL